MRARRARSTGFGGRCAPSGNGRRAADRARARGHLPRSRLTGGEKGSTESKKGEVGAVGRRRGLRWRRGSRRRTRASRFWNPRWCETARRLKDGTPLGTPLGTPRGHPRGHPTGPSSARANASESLDDLRTRLRAAEAAAADAKPTRRRLASRRRRRRRGACASRFGRRERQGFVRGGQGGGRGGGGGARSKNASPGSKTIYQRCRGKRRWRGSRRRGRLWDALAAGDVDGARSRAEATADASRDAARTWSERVASGGGRAPETLGERAMELLDAGGVAGRARRSWRTLSRRRWPGTDDGDGERGGTSTAPAAYECAGFYSYST